MEKIYRNVNFKALITLCVFCTLRWLLGPRQMKCTCNANSSTYKLHLDFIFYFGKFEVLFLDNENIYSKCDHKTCKRET